MTYRQEVSRKFIAFSQTLKIDFLKPAEKEFKPVIPIAGSMVMFYIFAHGPCTMSDITRIMHCSKQQTTQTVDKLISAQMAQRSTDEKDRRRVWISLTQKGVEAVRGELERFSDIIAEALKALNEKELLELSDALDVMNYSFERIAQVRGI